jgi:hypothetical protein
VNFSLGVIVLGAPAALMLLREQSTLTPARLLAGVVGWRVRAATLRSPSEERPVRRGGIRLDRPAALPVEDVADDVAWPELEEARA